jgi:DNA-binding transcriptional LysR family regulator
MIGSFVYSYIRNLRIKTQTIMDFRLKVFQKAAERLSFTKAAKDLFITQPAVSKHIHELEKHFGQALFNRHGNRVSLTSKGELLATYSTKILRLYIEMEDAFLALDDKFPDKITIGASTTISQYILPKVLSKFKSAYPQTTITLLNDNSENIQTLVINKEIVIGLTEGTTNHPQLHHETFIHDEIVLVTNAANAIIHKDEITVKELQKIPLILREKGSGTREVIEKNMRNAGLETRNLNVEMVLGSSESIKSYLLYSNAAAFLSIHSIIEELKMNKLKVVDIKGFELKRTFEFVNIHGEYSSTIQKIKQFFHSHYNLME